MILKNTVSIATNSSQYTWNSYCQKLYCWKSWLQSNNQVSVCTLRDQRYPSTRTHLYVEESKVPGEGQEQEEHSITTRIFSHPHVGRNPVFGVPPQWNGVFLWKFFSRYFFPWYVQQLINPFLLPTRNFGDVTQLKCRGLSSLVASRACSCFLLFSAPTSEQMYSPSPCHLGFVNSSF